MNQLFLVIPLGVAISLLLLPFAIYYDSEIMRITSDSMIPTIHPNDIIIVQQTTIDQIKIDDIIVFDLNIAGVDKIAHRVYALGLDHEGHFGIDTKGDNIAEPDTWTVYEENLTGIVIDIIPTIGILLIDSIRYILIAITIITAFSMLWEYYKKEKINS